MCVARDQHAAHQRAMAQLTQGEMAIITAARRRREDDDDGDGEGAKEGPPQPTHASSFL